VELVHLVALMIAPCTSSRDGFGHRGRGHTLSPPGDDRERRTIRRHRSVGRERSLADCRRRHPVLHLPLLSTPSSGLICRSSPWLGCLMIRLHCRQYIGGNLMWAFLTLCSPSVALLAVFGAAR